ncbi:hypothetical protein CSKR_110114 [Clonorchis sinensis]|uniref:Uncharacterized protein n=1 Tax=Clonorchis sinensis TaxID=79923 RepID=A0A3R7D9C3_CLOSI|nr:hypothetical protein CSKR_110114 [Clonorchis sinensis]
MSQIDQGLADSCTDLICHTIIRTNTTSKICKTLHNFQYLSMDLYTKGRDDFGQLIQKHLRLILLFDDEDDVICICKIDNVFVTGYLDAGVLEAFQRSCHDFIDHEVKQKLLGARRILSHVRKSWNTKSLLCSRTSGAYLGGQACQVEQTGQPSQMRLGNPGILELWVAYTYGVVLAPDEINATRVQCESKSSLLSCLLQNAHNEGGLIDRVSRLED